jgi:hypothetical protein
MQLRCGNEGRERGTKEEKKERTVGPTALRCSQNCKSESGRETTRTTQTKYGMRQEQGRTSLNSKRNEKQLRLKKRLTALLLATLHKHNH